MDFKKLFENNKAVSPVIGVILMVAITVILAAAIGSSVFSKGTVESAPQASLSIKAFSNYDDSTTPETPAVVKIEHLGGDSLNLANTVTKIMISVNSGGAQQAEPIISTTDTDGTETFTTGSDTSINFGVGDIKKLKIVDNDGAAIEVSDGSIVNIKFIDAQTNQIICDKDVRF